MMELLTDPQVWITLVTLSAIEIVLGIDNLVFISIAVSKLPPHQREVARKFGIAVACITRILLLLTLAWLAGLTADLFTLFGQGISVRDLVLILGGVFLLVKGTKEILELVKGEPDSEDVHTRPAVSFAGVIAQIAVIDIVFSLDSVIAAVGMANHTPVMVAAILLAVAVMLLAARPLGQFIDNNPTIKMLALAFIVAVGAYLLLDGFELHIEKGYLYGAMGFSALVECLNLWAKKRANQRMLRE
ncbi:MULTISPECIES: TerC family protein [unclassified Pseudoxanthomonas]|jgi:predicted tellurium resistance membrane protein TerC|uniref:TerC family protein n=1 Tax=unclassified Pseudoxanthomonas TaxID=2645906 RepID=UPI0008849AE9|nr:MULTISPECIES: TerC family protein [unclassified Pseudoxanthomonas]PPJ41895.1 TerC family protein [Pseudoxanthomonas sp. KAs_5_3]SDQ42683.1 Membrane protein TerC, possibly involved in tellurium resistance [Pseudoxanthomonas sp. CF385]SFV29288.1 Membrane protein TerC, possibly involved in tellurium resistance [Pseudoxanthomonas sp. YR558]